MTGTILNAYKDYPQFLPHTYEVGIIILSEEEVSSVKLSNFPKG